MALWRPHPGTSTAILLACTVLSTAMAQEGPVPHTGDRAADPEEAADSHKRDEEEKKD